METAFVNRGRLEIIRDILSVCGKPARKTSILYKCNLSYGQLLKYLRYLVSCGLICSSKSNPKEVFHITDKGRQFLKVYEGLRNFVDETRQNSR